MLKAYDFKCVLYPNVMLTGPVYQTITTPHPLHHEQQTHFQLSIREKFAESDAGGNEE